MVSQSCHFWLSVPPLLKKNANFHKIVDMLTMKFKIIFKLSVSGNTCILHVQINFYVTKNDVNSCLMCLVQCILWVQCFTFLGTVCCSMVWSSCTCINFNALYYLGLIFRIIWKDTGFILGLLENMRLTIIKFLLSADQIFLFCSLKMQSTELCLGLRDHWWYWKKLR